MAEDDARFVARARPRAFYSMFGISSLFAGLSGWSAWFANELDFSRLLLTWSVCAIFSCCALLALVRMRRKAPILEMDAEGLRWPWRRMTLPWSALAAARIDEWKRMPVIALSLADPEGIDDRRLRGAALLSRQSGFGGDLGVTLRGSDRSLDEAVAAMRSYAPHLFAD